MKNKFSKMMFAFVATIALSVSTMSATWVSVQVTPGSFASEISWSLNDATTGTTLASTNQGYYSITGIPIDYWVNVADGCYIMELYDSWGDGWNGATYQIVDSLGNIYGSGGLISGSFGADLISVNVTCVSGCTDSTAVNYDPTAVLDDGSCVAPCALNEVTLTMDDSFGDGWNGNVWNLFDLNDTLVASGTILSGSSASETFCLPDGCYTLSCDGGTWQAEVSWLLSDNNGDTLAFGGAPDFQNLNLNSTCPAGCTDAFASNYDPLAVFDDASCLFPGCLDNYALNYCASCNVNDSLSCVYPTCNLLDFTDDFEAANLSGNDWTTLNGIESSVSLTSANAIADTVSLEFTGNSFTGWINTTLEAGAFANTDHVSSATVCLDMTGSAASVNMTIDAEVVSYYSSAYSWFRVKVGGVVTADVAGNTSYNTTTASGVNNYTYDLSAYANQSQVYVTIETACKYGPLYNTVTNVADYVRVDNINVFNVYPCTYYTATASATDASCNAGADGTATVVVSSPNLTYDTYLWSDGQTTATATGLVAGTYTCTTTDTINGCTSTVTATVGEPTAVLVTGVVVDATSPIANNGSVDLTVTGGTPCYSGSNTVSGTSPNNSYGGNVFNVIATNDLGISSVDLFVQAGIGDIWVYYMNGSCEGNELNASAWTLGTQVSNMSNVPGLMNVPVTIPMSSGDTVGLYVLCSDGMQYTSGNAAAYTQVLNSDANMVITNGGGLGTYSPFSGSIFGPPNGARDFSGNVNYGTADYTYAWSNGATTQDVDSLGMGPISCTVTDCNGCTATFNGFIAVSIVSGCMDTLASNYDPAANTSCTGCCTYLGCIDSLALNFDPTANLDDGSCSYSCAYQGFDDEITVTFVSDFWASESEWWVISFSGDTVLTSTAYVNGTATYVSSACALNDCYNFVMADAFGDGGGTSTVTNSNGDTLGVFTCIGAGNSGTFGLGQVCITGCMDPAATNYDATATISDSSSCIYCNDNLVTLYMYDSWGDGWNGAGFILQDATTGFNAMVSTLLSGSAGTDQVCIVDGCYNIEVTAGSFASEISWLLADNNGDTLAFGGAPTTGGGAPYSGTLTLGSASCTSGCTDMIACNYDASVVYDDGSCDYSCIGCSDSLAYNYGGSVITIDDGSCMYCATTASATTSPASDSISSSGSVDLTLVGANCITTNDLLVSVAGGNGQSGNAFNLINTSGSPLYIEGFSQGPGSGNTSATGVSMEVFCSYSDYTVGTPTWTSVATAVVDLTASLTTGYVSIPGGITIPAGGTYGFWVGSSTNTVQYTNGTGIVGVTAWASDANVTVTEGHGGTYPTGLNFSPRNWNGTVHYGDPNATVGTYLWSNGATTEDLTAVSYGTYTVTGTDCNGCTFSASATVGVNMIAGCTDPLALNFDSLANYDDGSCIAIVNGCTDSTAANYDPTSNVDDGSCHFCFGSNSVTIECGGGSFASEVSWTLFDGSGAIVLSGGAPFLLDTCLNDGCYTLSMVDSWGDGWNGNEFSITENVSGTATTATLASGSAGTANLSSTALGCYTYGCTDPLATNYDATVNTDDGTCSYATCVDGSQAICEDFETGGNMTITAGVNAISSVDSGYGNNSTYAWVGQGTTFAGYGATPSTGALAFDPSKSTHFSQASYCVDLTTVSPGSQVAINFDYRGEYSFSVNYAWMRIMVDTTLMTTLSGQTYLQPNAAVGTWESHAIDLSAYVGQSINVIFETSNKYSIGYTTAGGGGDMGSVDNVCIVAPIYGCTDMVANNYNPAATVDDGTCVFPCTNATGYSHGFEDGIASLNLTPADWTQNTDDNSMNDPNGNWFWDNLGTGSSNTGPNYSTNYGGTGYAMEGAYYMYVESSGNYTNDVSMTSHCFDISTLPNPTFSFWYNMYDNGENVSFAPVGYVPTGSLDVMLSSDGGITWDSTWTASGNQGVDWVQANIDVSAYAATGVTVKITGNTSTYYTSDICIDAMSMVNGSAVYGCTDSTATNYNVLATADDGSCIYPCLDNTVPVAFFDSWGDGWNGAIMNVTDTSGNLVTSGTLGGGFFYYDTLCLTTGCYDVVVGGGSFDSEITFNFGSLVGAVAGSYTVSVGGALCGIPGCTDPLASNYDASATLDDGSCTYCSATYANISVGGGSFMNEVSWTLSNSAGSIILSGGAPFSLDTCLADDCYTVDMADSWGDGWNGSTFDLDGVVLGTILTGSTGSFTFATGSASCAVSGCMDPLASNYDPLATIDDGSCTYPCLLDEVTLNLYDSWGDGWNNNTITVGGVDYTIVSGDSASFTLCVDLSICNTATYNATGTYTYENSWEIIDASGSIIASGGDNSDDFGVCTVLGCTDSTAFNYNVLANVDDGSCTPVLFGCIDSTAVNYYALANTDDGSCLFAGCTDPLAFNYDPTANLNDGSCIAVVLGCTDQLACNYDASANTDDGSCNSDVVTVTLSDLTGDGWNGGYIVIGSDTLTQVNTYGFPYSANASETFTLCVDLSTCNNVDYVSGSYSYENSWSVADASGNVLASGGNISGEFGVCPIYGCTDPLALNYDPTATDNDGSCTYPVVCSKPVATGLYTDEIIHTRARVHWDNMTSATCLPYKYKIWYREVGTSSWSVKTAQDAGLCQFGLGTTSKMISGLTAGTTYEWQIKSYYCGTTGASIWSSLQTFTTADECPNVINFAVSTPTPTKAVFTWDTTAAYSFVRIKLRVDSISNPMGTDWFSAGGFGVNYPALTRNKNGLTAGQTYRGQAKTWCDPNGGLYRATSWTPLVFWTQPNTIRLEGGTAINNLDVYPNPSRDIFNVNFTSEDIQNLEVRIINVIGEVVYTENLNQFVGEYTKQVDLSTYTKGVYFLEITTDNGVINKKLILQ
jgi:hypothetical protein